MPPVTHLLRAALNPHTVAVVGASSDPAKFGGRVMQFLVQHGYAGRIVPVNPNAAHILGLPAYKTVTDAGVAIDVALLAVPAAHLALTLEQCGVAGVPCCVVLTADFAELGEEGAAREAELVRIARRHGMRLIGPNCLGFINPSLNLALTSSVALAMKPMPAGAIGLISQSGSMMASMISHAADAGAGFSACITVGNQADLEICDFIEYFLEDDATRAVCIYVEGLRDAQRFLTLAQRCRAAGKPLLAVKAGSSEAGAQVARSHTASLAGSHALWEAACRDHGIVAVDDPESMIDCAHFLVRFGGAKSAGVAVISPSGGTIAVTADRIAAAGLELATLSEDTRNALRTIVPPSRPLNPLDVGGLPREAGVTAAEDAQALLSNDATVGVVLIVVATSPQLDEKVRRWGTAAIASGKPTAIVFTPGRLVDSARAALREIGCPYTDRLDDALRVVRAANDYGAHAGTPAQALIATEFSARVVQRAADLPRGRLTEMEAKSLLRDVGIATTQDILATSADAASAAAARIGYPVVMKAVCRELVHKSDIGAVRLGLSNVEAVRSAWRDIVESVERNQPGAKLDGCVVQQFAAGGVELILGARWDAQFGAAVMVGAGGVYVEILKDVALALAPLTRDRARSMLESLQLWPLLNGARGRPACDIESLTAALVHVGALAHALGPRLVELDVNPLLAQTSGVIALDARATLT